MTVLISSLDLKMHLQITQNQMQVQHAETKNNAFIYFFGLENYLLVLQESFQMIKGNLDNKRKMRLHIQNLK